MSSRKIKFRIWRFCHSEKRFKFYYLSSQQICTNNNDLVFAYNYNQKIEATYCDDNLLSYEETLKEVKIQQFTGFIDKNYKEIYEGDIVSFSIPKITHGPEEELVTGAEVHWDEEWGCWTFGKFKSGIGQDFGYTCWDRIDTESFEITGNIFEK